MLVVSTAFATNTFSQNNEVAQISKTIQLVAEAADNSNAAELGKYLDENYRIVMNQLFGSTEISVMPKEVYLDKIEKKEFGGDERDVTIENITINGKTANAQVIFKGKKMTFRSLVTLVQDATGNWKIIQEAPTMKAWTQNTWKLI